MNQPHSPTPIIRTLLLALGMLTASCAAQPIAGGPAAGAGAAEPGAAASASAADPAQLTAAVSFAQWRDQFRREALALGIDAQTFDAAFADITPDPEVLRADSSQPEFTRPVWEYLEGATAAGRVRTGLAKQAQEQASLAAIYQQYGVEAAYLVAIWGMESNYGQFMGKRSVIRSLATLAHAGRRQRFAHTQLLAALSILQQGDIDARHMRGSWAGAMGQTQFMPTTFNTHAVDFDGDGRRDIWNSAADALASAAHYLKASGWQRGQPWGFEVQLRPDFDYAQADPDSRRSVRAWRALGVITPALPAPLDDANAVLLLPAGHRGPALLVLDNFRAILKYNNSTSYALAIGLLSDRLQGKDGIRAPWPVDEQPLSHSQRVALQDALRAKGFDPGPADGIIGANTRKAVRSYQQRQGWPADGYPTLRLLEALQR